MRLARWAVLFLVILFFDENQLSSNRSFIRRHPSNLTMLINYSHYSNSIDTNKASAILDIPTYGPGGQIKTNSRHSSHSKNKKQINTSGNDSNISESSSQEY